MLILYAAFHKFMELAGKYLHYVKEKLEIEMNAATDNPLIVEDGESLFQAETSMDNRLPLQWIS